VIGRTLPRDPVGAFRALHGFRPAAPTLTRVPTPRAHLVDLYQITRLEGLRWTGNELLGVRPTPKPFFHNSQPGAGPTLAADAVGHPFLVGGTWRITDHGIEDDTTTTEATENPTMARGFMARNSAGQFVPSGRSHGYGAMVPRYAQAPAVYYSPSYGGGYSNPWNPGPVITAALVVGGGLLTGLAVNAVVQALPVRVGETVKDGISIAAAIVFAFVPSTFATRLFGISAAAVLVGGVINRRTDATNRVVSWIHTKFAALWDRAMGPATPANPTNPAVTPPAGAPPQLGAGAADVDAFGLPVVRWSGAPQDAYAARAA
jgi:hypothetical protein